ncbi:hypothetical protein IKE79_01575 [Candidatus Saccharibacteria bacterium]|nr:hypothetical protein [Candidatus Saccharibacteria bacterium]
MVNKKRIIIVCTVTLIVIVASVMFLINAFKYSNYSDIKIINYISAQDNIHAQAREILRTEIFSLLNHNFGLSEEDEVDIVIRQETYKEYMLDKNMSAASFIVDIDKYQQTYLINIGWYDKIGEPMIDSVSIECTTRDLMKYPDEKCYGMYTTSESVEIYLPYNGRLENGEEFTVTKGYGGGDKEVLEIDFNNCGDARLMAEAKNTVREWVESLGLDADKYDYLVPTKYDKCLIR